MIRRLHHAGVLVADAAPVTAALELIGLPRESVEQYGDELDIGFHPCGDALLEVITPSSSKSWNADWLARSGPCIQHLAFEVPDLKEALRSLREQGVAFLDPAPRAGARGTTVAFLDPVATGSILLELVEDPASPFGRVIATV